VAFPRSLRIVRSQESIAHSVAQTTEAPALHVREASALMQAVLGSNGVRVTRTTAMQVPAVQKALKTYTATISAFPLREYVSGQPVVARAFLSCPCDTLPYAALMQRTVTDLLLYDRAYWHVTSRSWDGFPATAEIMRVEDVNDLTTAFTGVDPNTQPPSDPFYWLGNVVPTRDVIKYYGDGNGGWLSSGASSINTAAALEAAVLMYAESPIAQVVLKNNGADLPADQVDALLEAWEEARVNHVTAYLNSTIDAKAMGINPSEMQLDDARNNAAIQIARIANLDPIWTGAGVPGSSLTYSNRIDLYRQLLDTALRPVMDLIAQRLTMPDVTPRGHVVTFDTSVFLRANPVDIAGLASSMIPLGVMSIDEARTLLDLPELGATQE
jgi:hypothetical protein